MPNNSILAPDFDPSSGIDDSSIFVSRFSDVCTKCAHLDLSKAFLGIHSCKAFSKIPDEIWKGDNDHTKPYPGDRGIQFSPRRLKE